MLVELARPGFRCAGCSGAGGCPWSGARGGHRRAQARNGIGGSRSAMLTLAQVLNARHGHGHGRPGASSAPGSWCSRIASSCLCVEPAVPDGLVFIERRAEVGKRAIIQRGAEEIATRLVPGVVVPGEGEIKGVRREERILLPEGVGATAGPRIRSRVGYHARTHGVEPDVAPAREKVSLGLHERRCVPAVPERSGWTQCSRRRISVTVQLPFSPVSRLASPESPSAGKRKVTLAWLPLSSRLSMIRVA